MQTKEKDWDTTGLCDNNKGKKHKEKEHSDVFTDNIHCGVIRRPQKQQQQQQQKQLRYRCLRTSLSVQQGIRRRRTGTQRDCVTTTRGKNTRRRSIAMFSQTTYTVASLDGHKNNNNNKNNLDIDVYVRPSPYNRVFEEEGLGHNGTV